MKRISPFRTAVPLWLWIIVLDCQDCSFSFGRTPLKTQVVCPPKRDYRPERVKLATLPLVKASHQASVKGRKNFYDCFHLTA